jgi:hypothetical protein
MTVRTEVIWATNSLTQEQLNTIYAFATAMKDQGATDGTFEETEVPQGKMVVRHWTTVNDATSWITFVADFNPVSASIIE